MHARLAAAVSAALLLFAAAPASAVVLGTAQLRIDGAVVLTAATPSAPVVSTLAPENGAPSPFAGLGYGYIAEMTGTLSAVSTLPPSAPAIYEASGAATLGDDPLAAFGPTDYGVLRLDAVLADPPFPAILAALAAVPLSGLESYSDPVDRLDGFFSYAATSGPGAVSASFNGFLGFDDPIVGTTGAGDLVGGFDPMLGDLVNGLLSDLFFRTVLGETSPSEPFSVRADVVASAIPVPLAAPMLIAALGAAAVASRRRRAARGRADRRDPAATRTPAGEAIAR